MQQSLRRIGQVIGIVSGAGASACWIVAMVVEGSGLELGGLTFIVALGMAVMAMIAVIASVHGHGIVLMVLFFASFFPVGMSILDLPTWAQAIGVLNIGYFLAGLILWWANRMVGRDEPG